MVVVATALVAARPPAADVALRDGIGICARPVGDRLLKLTAKVAVVCQELLDAIGFGFEIHAGLYDVEAVRKPVLNLRDELGVEAKLQDRAAARLAGELGVVDLVGEGAEVAWGIDAAKNVGAPQPTSVVKGGLDDDFGAGAHCFDGGVGGFG